MPTQSITCKYSTTNSLVRISQSNMTKGMTKLVNCDKIAQMNVYYFDEFLWASYGHLLLTIINIINIIEHTWGKWNLKEKTKWRW